MSIYIFSTPAGCQGAGCRQGRKPEHCDCGLKQLRLVPRAELPNVAPEDDDSGPGWMAGRGWWFGLGLLWGMALSAALFAA